MPRLSRLPCPRKGNRQACKARHWALLSAKQSSPTATHHQEQQIMSTNTPPTPQSIINYLKQHPDFFLDHADQLLELKLPAHNQGGVISFVERQAELQIGRASCRERVWISGGGGAVEQKRERRT